MPDFVQMRNADTGMWVKIDRKSGAVIAERKVRFLNVPVTAKDSETYEVPRVARRQARMGDPLGALRR